MNNVNTILFDLDGTITDSGPSIINAYAYTYKKMGLDVPSREDLMRFVGPPLVVNLASFVSDEKIEEARSHYMHYLVEQKAALRECTIYDGVADLLNDLKEKRRALYICSSKAEPVSHEVLNHFKLLDCFSSLYGSQLDGSGANKADIIGRAINENGLDPQTTLMVGDRSHDVIGAKAHGVASVGVLWGYGSESEFKEAGADYIVKTPQDLEKLVLG